LQQREGEYIPHQVASESQAAGSNKCDFDHIISFDGWVWVNYNLPLRLDGDMFDVALAKNGNKGKN
jgi:hypothetical protein